MSIQERIDKEKVIAVIILDQLKHAIPLAKALVSGGVTCIELTLRTQIALEAGRAIKKEVPEILLGYGTVLTIDQVKEAKDASGDFAVSPGCNPKIIREAIKQSLPFAPGIMTPTDIELAVQEGCKLLKYFPAETTGGMKHLTSMAAPYLHLGLKFIPLGGVNIHNARTYLESPLISAIGGSWIAKRDLINKEDWSAIASNAQQISTLLTELNQ